MAFYPQTRGDPRAWVGVIALGAAAGVAVAGAYRAGGAARGEVVHAQMQKLAGAAASGFTAAALDSAAQNDPGALAIARAHDPLAGAPLDPRERRIAALVDRLGAMAPPVVKAAPAPNAFAQVAEALHLPHPGPPPVLRARFELASFAPPFQLRGVVDRSRDLDCLAQAVYYEARGETRAGQAAVAQVVLNRVRHPAFPKSVCAVVFQGARSSACQFAFACDGSTLRPTETEAWRRAEDIAARALKGVVMAEVGQAVSFHAARAPADWAPSMQKVAQIGAHVFYRFPGHGASPRLLHQAATRPAAPAAEPQALPASVDTPVTAEVVPG